VCRIMVVGEKETDEASWVDFESDHPTMRRAPEEIVSLELSRKRL
jgi:hypothetical protein